MITFERFRDNILKKDSHSTHSYHPPFDCEQDLGKRPSAKVTLHCGFVLIENVHVDYLSYCAQYMHFESHIIFRCKNCGACQAVIKSLPRHFLEMCSSATKELSLNKLYHKLYHTFDESIDKNVFLVEETIPNEFVYFISTKKTAIHHIKDHCVIIQNVPKDQIQNVSAGGESCLASFIYEDKTNPDIIHVLHKLKQSCVKYIEKDLDTLLSEKAESCQWLFLMNSQVKVNIHKRSSRHIIIQ